MHIHNGPEAEEVVDGNPDTIIIVDDRRTVAKDLKGRSPSWKLVATESSS